MTFGAVPDYFFNQSGVIPYRIKNGKVQILLITSSSGRNWIIPKGVVEPDMTPQKSALQEAFEEAGVAGEVAEVPVGSYFVEKWGGICTIVVYPMLVTKVYDNWLEDDFRKRKWLSIDRAVEKASKKEVKNLIKELSSVLSSNG